MLKALALSDVRLRTVCTPLTTQEIHTQNTQETIESLLDFVYGRNNKGEKSDSNRPTTIGLSANQVGIMKKICIVDMAVRRRGYSDIHVMINPVLEWKSKSLTIRREGCVNKPGIFGMVSRANRVKVSYLDRWGNKSTIDAVGWCAVLLQHEIDHLNGILFIDRLKDPKKAHKVNENNMKEYKKRYREWDKFTDVSKWKRVVPGEGLEPT